MAVNSKNIKRLNTFRIIDIIVVSIIFVILMYTYLTMLFGNGSYAVVELLLSFTVIPSILFSGLIILLNVIGGKKFVAANIKTASILNIILSVVIFLCNISFLFEYEITFSTIISLIIAPILFIYNIYKLKLLKVISTNSPKTKNGKYIISYFVISIIVFIVLFISAFNTTDCNRHYKINERQLKKQLKEYTYIGEKEVDVDSYSFFCRTKDVKTYIYFYDKYNNKINLTISDKNNGRLHIGESLHVIDQIQFVNNILKNKKLKIYYENEGYNWYDYEIVLDDENLENAFDIVVGIFHDSEKEHNIILHSYDIKKTDYSLSISLYDRRNANIDKESIMPHLDSFALFIYNAIGKGHNLEIEVQLGKDLLTLKKVASNQVIWEISDYDY